MLFNSYIFLFVFLPVTAAGFALAGRLAPRLALHWLTLCSLCFYGFWNPAYLWLLGGSITVNFAIAAAITGTRARWARNVLLASGVAANLALIGYFKYAGFFLEVGHAMAGSAAPLFEITLPLGISFFTFQQIAYLVDAWKGEVREHRLVEYSLFVTFFPQLIAGPIVHHREVMPQLTSRRRFQFAAEDVAAGICVFVIGLVKKVVLADNVSEYANGVFDAAAAGSSVTTTDAWIGAMAFTFQLYFDFSGYSDMAVGLGRMFGVRLPVNFFSPYKAVSISEFWRRWHITLSRFLRDYLYIPLGGNRRGGPRRYANLLVTMLLGGLWHGAGWTFVLWGLLHGLYLCIHHAWQHVAERAGWHWRTRPAWSVAAAGLTFVSAVAAWVLFRAASIAAAERVYAAMVGLGSPGAEPLIARAGEAFGLLAGLAAIVWLLPNTQQVMERVERGLAQPLQLPSRLRALAPLWNFSYASGAVMAVVFVLTVASMTKVREFLYYQF